MAEAVDWLKLPEDLLSYMIAERLTREKDLIRFGAVCRSWQSIHTVVKCRRSPRLPFLMLATEHNKEKQTRSFYSLTNKTVCNTQVPVPANRFCAGSSHGWLIIEYPKFQVSLLNPFNGNEIHLPASQAFQHEGNSEDLFHNILLYKAILSANPSTESDYVVLAIFTTRRVPAFFKPGAKTWTSLAKRLTYVIDVIYYRDKFYAHNKFGGVFVLDLNRPDPTVVELEIAPSLGLLGKSYLVESYGELLGVERYMKDGRFHVFKLDSEKKKWSKVENLEGRVLFVGYNSSLCLLASDYPECKPNSIYYTDYCHLEYSLQEEYGLGPYDMGIFSFDELTICKHNSETWVYPAPIWVEPPEGVISS